MPKLGVYSKEIVLARPDGRTREARLLKQMRAALVAHLGGEGRLTPPRRALVERAAMLQLRLAILDAKILDGGFTDHDSRAYLAWNNSLARLLGQLGLEPAASKQPADPMAALRAHVAARQGSEAA